MTAQLGEEAAVSVNWTGGDYATLDVQGTNLAVPTFGIATFSYDPAQPLDSSLAPQGNFRVEFGFGFPAIISPGSSASFALTINGARAVKPYVPPGGNAMVFHKSEFPGVDWSNVDTLSFEMDIHSAAREGILMNVDSLQFVPEPREYALIAGIGLAGLVGYRRFRKG